MSGYEYHGSEVAIIGMACRFPGANGIEEFWRLLVDGAEGITFFTDEELVAAGVDPADLARPDYVKAAPIVDGVDLFDAGYFGFTPREAELMDPQHRIFLECAVEALDHAGYGAGYDGGSVGVVAGGKMSTYVFNVFSNPQIAGAYTPIEIGLGNDIALLAMRASYHLNLTGPSYFVQSACSTSLVAVHLACQSLLLDECRMALAGAVAVDVPDKRGYVFREGSMMSADGHIRAFDAGANGTIFGCGTGALVLKRLEDALADGDRIYALIKGSATNNDGSAKASFTSPGVESEARAIVAALVNSEVSPDTISYVETHGTGTNLGDPIEIRALTRAFRTGTDRSGFCPIGSVKTNIGHLDAAAGMSSLIKTTLALDRGRLPPSLNFATPNPEIDFESSPFFVNTELRDWPRGGRPRRAGVSGFGFGGTNAHMILEEAPPATASGPSRPCQLLVLSARSADALERATDRLHEHLQGASPELDLADAAYTLKRGRRAFQHRRAVVCRDREEALAALAARDPRQVISGVTELAERPVAFLFSGQGSQHPNMGRELWEGEPTFRRRVDECAEILSPLLGRDLRQVLYPEPGGEEEAAGELRRTALAQPALFVVEHALAALWREWGVEPAAMIGHSIGEYVAACLAGVFSLADALALVAARGRLMQEMPEGAMLAVTLAEDEVLARLSDGLAVAAVNTDRRTVVSGPHQAVDALASRLEADGVACRRLVTSHAFHSAMMEPLLERFRAEVEKVELRAPEIPFVSNVTGTWITDEEATDPGYWVSHLRRPVRFAAGLEALLEDPSRFLLEVGPGNALTTLAEEMVKSQARGHTPAASSLPHPRDQRSQLAFLLGAAGRLWIAGAEVDGAGFYAHERRHRVPLPAYPFERRRYWVEAGEGPSMGHRLRKDPDVGRWFYIPTWRRSAPLPPPTPPADAGGILVLTDELGVGAGLVERLRRAGHDVVTVRAGAGFAAAGAGAYTAAPGRREDYTALVAELRAAGRLPKTVVHLWTLTAAPGELTADAFTAMQTPGFYSLMYLTQALGSEIVDGEICVQVVTDHLYEVVGGETLAPAKATLVGPCKVAPYEIPHLSYRLIDVAIPAGGPSEPLLERLLAEISYRGAEIEVAYRGPYRWTRTYEPRRLPEAPPDGLPARLRQRGVYLITGGLGGLGLVIAEHLAKAVKARLILVSRSGLPPRDAWPALVAGEEESPVKRRVEQVLALETLGAEVLPAAADVADREQMRRLLAAAHERFGDVHGVVHAAGVAGRGIILTKTPEEAERVMRPKTLGALTLHELFDGRALDFFVLFSSTASVFGDLGQVDYAAANSFLDALAQRRAASGVAGATVAINWDTWQQVGIAVDSEVPEEVRALRDEALRQGIANREGQEAFARLLAASCGPQVMVLTKDLDAMQKSLLEHQALVRSSSASGEMHPRPSLETAFVAPASELEETIAQVWQVALGIEQIGRLDNFFDVGGHSLLATQIVSRLRGLLGIELPIKTFFEAPTVAQLAEHVEMVRWAVQSAAATASGVAGDREEGEL